jgi:hypothetical protein
VEDALTRANQPVRSATHPVAQLPVEGHLRVFDGATGWINSPPLTATGLRGRVGQTMGLVAVTAALFAVGAYLGMNFAVQRSQGLTVTLLFGFGLLIGLATAPTLSYGS